MSRLDLKWGQFWVQLSPNLCATPPLCFHCSLRKLPNTWYDWSSNTGKKFYTIVFVLVLFVGIIAPLATNNGIFWSGYLSANKVFGGSNPYSSSANIAPSTWCVASASLVPTTASAMSAAGCSMQPVKVTANLIDAGSNKAVASNKYSCAIYIQTTGGWVATEPSITTGSGVTTCASSYTYTPGTSMIMLICETTSACTVGGPSASTNKQTYIYCPFPASSQTVTPPLPTPGGQCGQNGQGAGLVPAQATTASPPLTATVQLPFFALASSADNGYNTAQPGVIQWLWANGTSQTSTSFKAWLCGQNTPVNTACTSGNTAIPQSNGGIFSINLAFPFTSGTTPSLPYGAGCNGYTPVDPTLQSGGASVGSPLRGKLSCVLRMEVKNSGTTGMCIPSLAGYSAVAVSNNAANDIFYLFDLGSFNLVKDSGGNIIQPLPYLTATFNCSSLVSGNSCSSCMTIDLFLEPYFSIQYFQDNYPSNNPEAPTSTNTPWTETKATIGINA